jgi:hypothetical protein
LNCLLVFELEVVAMKVRQRSLQMSVSLLLMMAGAFSSFSQSSTGTITGTIVDENKAAISGVNVTGTNTATGFSRSVTSDPDGKYRLANMPTGVYELTFDAMDFRRIVRGGITLDSSQFVVVDVTLETGGIKESVTISGNASILNSTTAEVSTRFDSRRLSELPISANRNLLNVLLSVPGIGQLGPGQTAAATGISFSANGGRVRSNNFMIDGQDTNDAVFTGTGFALNNPDAFQEVLIVTNQFGAEYGRNSGAVVNFVGKSGTNDYHGSAFWFHNNEHLNSCNNLDKVASFAPTGYCNPNADTEDRKRAPKRLENQIGFTFGGPLTFPWFGDGGDPFLWQGTDKTFFFGDFQRWSDRSQNSGTTINGAPTAAGRTVLQSVAAGRPQVRAFLDFVPAGTPNGREAVFTLSGQTYRVPLGNLTGSSPFVFDDRQGSIRIDHRPNEANLIWARYRADSQRTSGLGQVTPPRHTLVNSLSSNALTVALNTASRNGLSNEGRIAWSRFSSVGDAEDPLSKTIPSIAIPGLGMTGAPATRTAIGFPPTQPGGRKMQTFQIVDSLSYSTGSHSMKFGVELRRTHVKINVFINARGSIQYRSLIPPSGTPVDISNFINDFAETASINLPLPGGTITGLYRWNEFYAFAQDEWRIRGDLNLTFGIRYEYPGDSFGYLEEVNKRVLAANGNNPAFRITPLPKPDANNFMPRLGINWSPRTSKKGLIGFITGGDKLVLRGGYARTYDANFTNIDANMFLSFPFVATQNFNGNNAFINIQNATVPDLRQPDRFERTVVSPDFRSPAADQISFDIQRELTKDLLLQIGYIRTRGTGLMQIVDANPCIPGRNCASPNFGNRVDPRFEVIRLYTNSASSTYDALQASLTKRLSNGLSAGLHYVWSTFIDDNSDIFGASAADLAISQDSFDRRADRARSSYDRPHRLTGNCVYEFPFYRRQRGIPGRILGGWQVNSVFTFQSGAPFTVLLGSDPACALCGGVGNSVRPNLNTNLDLSSMTITEILVAGGRNLFRTLDIAQGQRVGNAGRNILRADSLKIVDLGFVKNTQITDTVRVQVRADLFNAFNTRNFGIPAASLALPADAFLNKWATNGGNRRIILGARLVY